MKGTETQHALPSQRFDSPNKESPDMKGTETINMQGGNLVQLNKQREPRHEGD